MHKKIKTDSDLMYRYRCLKLQGKRQDEHRYIMEQYLGRKLTSAEIVHHKDGNPRNNSIENLQVMTRSEHARLHSAENSIAFRMTNEKRSEVAKRAWADGRCNGLKKSVKAIDPTTGNVLKEYESVASTMKDGYDPKSVSKCCKGRLHTYKSILWVFV